MRKNSNSEIPPLWRTSNVNKGAILSNGKRKRLLSLDNKSKQRYKVKMNNIQGYDPYHMKKEERSGSISNFLPVH